MIGDKMKRFLHIESFKKYYKDLDKFIKEEYKHQTVYPKQSDVFNAFNVKLEDIKVVILGQDPYHGPGQANGLAFSSSEIPPSLRNIFKEINDDLGIEIPNQGDLTPWVSEGVMLLNTILTVRRKEPLSHQNVGWEIFTDNAIKFIDERCENVVFMLWGNNARSKKHMIKGDHLILESAHPSPLSASRGFSKSKPFSKCNEYLVKNGKKPVNWAIKSIDLFNLN